MKISFLIMDIRAGGAEKVLSVLVNGLAQRGHEISVLCLNPRRDNHFFPLSPAVRVIGLDQWFPSCGKFIRDCRRVRTLQAVLRKERPQVLVSFLSSMNIYGAWAALLCRIPHIACERNSPWHKPEHPRKRKKRNFAFAVSAGCVFQTAPSRNYFPAHVRRRAALIPNPVVLTCRPLDEDAVREKVVISVGRYTEQKNQKLLLDSFCLFHKQFPDYRLEIYGADYGLKEQLRLYADQQGIGDQVKLNGPTEHIQERVRCASLFALSSDYEGMPNALAEAAALAVPCVATDCRSGGPALILDSGRRGALVPVGDVEAFAAAMIRLIGDRAEWLHMSRAGRALVETLSVEQFIQKWDAYLCSIAEKSYAGTVTRAEKN